MNNSNPSVDFRRGRLRVSDNRRFLQHEDGTPFFYLGDTAWELFHRLTREEAERYLENRRQKRFTVIQAVALAELDGLNTPNAYGDCPLHGNDPARPNERYFAYVDEVIRLAAEKGLCVGLLPTWGDKLQLLGHGIGPVVFNPDNAFAYGQWIARRYKNEPNLIWINGGDREGGSGNRAVWEALAAGIRSVDSNHLMTFHPPGGGNGRSSSEWFHEAEWLDFNLAQSGHECKNLPNYRIVEHDYRLAPIKPCLDGEPRYEDHAVNWKPEIGWFDDYDARQAAYWALLSGACGHTYGCHGIWQFSTPDRTPIGHNRHSWYDVLDLPGSFQMTHARSLMESRPVLSRVPDQTLLAEPGEGSGHKRAARGEGYAFVYLPAGGEVTVSLESADGPTLQVSWFDPRTGRSTEPESFSRADRKTFRAPSEGRGNDWVLVIDSKQRPA